MGYIEREKIGLTDFEIVMCNGDYKEAFKMLLEKIESIPAADVQPVVHGRWVQIGGKYSRHKTIDRRILTCSVCSNALSMEGVNAGRGDANFCPNCGADMRPEPQKEKS